VLKEAPVTLVNDSPLGDPHAVVLAARNRQFVPSQTSTFVSVVFQRSAPVYPAVQAVPAAAAAVPNT
jgi:hypothetical protein